MLFSTAEGDSLMPPTLGVTVGGRGLESATSEGAVLTWALGLEADVTVLGATRG
jgi:hypothetical protein